MIKVGQKVEFGPDNDIQHGVVKYVHPTHCWFSVEHGTDDYKWRTSFKFDDIGVGVRLVEE